MLLLLPTLALTLAVALAGAACTRDPAINQQKAFERGQAYLAQGKYNERGILLLAAYQR